MQLQVIPHLQELQPLQEVRRELQIQQIHKPQLILLQKPNLEPQHPQELRQGLQSQLKHQQEQKLRQEQKLHPTPQQELRLELRLELTPQQELKPQLIHLQEQKLLLTLRRKHKQEPQ